MFASTCIEEALAEGDGGIGRKRREGWIASPINRATCLSGRWCLDRKGVLWNDIMKEKMVCRAVFSVYGDEQSLYDVEQVFDDWN